MRRSRRRSLSVLVAAAMLVTGCASTSEDAAKPAGTAAPTPTPTASSPAPSASAAPQAGLGPVDTYLAWLAASRKPDPKRACALMTPALQKRVMAEFSGTLGATFGSCAEMITKTAAVYAATGASAEVEVKVVSESATQALLFSTYVGTGKCGTIGLTKQGGDWIMNKQTQGCAAS